MIDTHTHLYLDDFEGDKEGTVKRALDAGVDHLVFPNVDRSTLPLMKQLHAEFPDNISMAIGLHPTEVDDSDIDKQLQFVCDEIASGRYVAVGEVGIDLYWDRTYREKQIEILRRQMDLAAEYGLPVIIHCREGLDEVLDVIDSLDKVPQCVLHSFGGTVDDVRRIRRRGDFYFGINGIVTFKNSRLRETLPEIGIERILLETDAPYLAPVPHRGKRNESSFMIHTAAYIADILGITREEVDRITTQSAKRFFKI